MTNPLSVSLNIDKEIDVENQILEFKRFLKNAEEDIATIRNKYISKVGKKKYQELHRKSLGSFKDIKKSHDEDTKSNISQVLDDNFNKSLPNFKKFIVR